MDLGGGLKWTAQFCFGSHLVFLTHSHGYLVAIFVATNSNHYQGSNPQVLWQGANIQLVKGKRRTRNRGSGEKGETRKKELNTLVHPYLPVLA